MSTNEHPLVSVCIPVYNGSNFILDCIESILSQSYTNIELLIVDNCSTDSTPEIIKKVKDDRIRYVKNEVNIGAINNFSKCVQEARGEYFVLLPHDDKLRPGCLLNYVKQLEDPKIGFVYSAIHVIDENGDTLHTKINHDMDEKYNSEEAIADIVDFFVPIQLTMVRTHILKKLGGFDIYYGLFCDVHLWLRVALDGWGSFYHAKPYSSHRSHAQQGQAAFLNPDLEVLSDHWGKKLDDTFWIENSYNHLFLKLSHFLLSEMEAHHYDASHAKIELLKIFAVTHFRGILVAMIKLDFHVVMRDLSIVKPLIKEYGFRNVLLFYPMVIMKATVQKLSNKLNLCLA
jgi:glycosyltransferase involved in cell wall biosynthesis